jgi:hypothetical protein
VQSRKEEWFLARINDDLDMQIFELTKIEVQREFAEAFNELYEIYVLESDSKLSEKAKELKEKITESELEEYKKEATDEYF